MINKTGLSEQTVSQIQSVFQKHPAVEQAILYGSRARGNFKEGSDIDLTLIGNMVTLKELCLIDGELDDLMLPYTFDLSIYNELQNESLKEHIKCTGILFYQAIKEDKTAV